MTDPSPIILWFRRDLRLADHQALSAACATGRPVIPVFLNDPVLAGQGAAARFRIGLSVDAFGQALEGIGSRLILRQGDALEQLRGLIAESGAGTVWWSRLYDPTSKKRDTVVKAALKEEGIDARSFGGHVLFEPWEVETGAGGFYRVFTPFWRAVRDRDVPDVLPAPTRINAPETWPKTEKLRDWRLDAAMGRGASVVAQYQRVGEDAARERLEIFIDEKIDRYDTARDLPAEDGTSGLSENLTYGEISPRQCWHAALRAHRDGVYGAEVFLQEIAWREFAYHLLHHTPQIETENWKPEWDAFPWNSKITDEVTAWQQGRTGIPFVDAAMRQMYVTGTMHNRARMIVASYLTKHMMTHWKVGLDWFADCLTDWDPASNAMGWQWVAGSGPDASPYFRIFNPETQLEKFDTKQAYPDRWIAERQDKPPETALDYFAAVPKRWKLNADQPYPKPVVALDVGRQRALAAYGKRDGTSDIDGPSL